MYIISLHVLPVSLRILHPRYDVDTLHTHTHTHTYRVLRVGLVSSIVVYLAEFK